MRNTITLKTYSDITIVDIEGEIGIPESEHYSDNVRLGKIALDFRNSLNEIAGIKASTTIVNIRSTGGDVDDAMLVYKALKLLDSKVVTRCFGYCGSAATVIAQAASCGCREILDTSLYLIHRCTIDVSGNIFDIDSAREMLENRDRQIAEIYAKRTMKNSIPDFLELMSFNNGAGKWLSPQQAIAVGLADRIITHEDIEIYNASIPLWKRVKKKIGL